MTDAKIGQTEDCDRALLDRRKPAIGGDAFQQAAVSLAAGVHPGAPAYTALPGHASGGHIGQATSAQVSYSIGGSATQLPQFIGESSPPASMLAGPSPNQASIGTLSSAQQAQQPRLAVPMSIPGQVALPGEVMGSITLPVLNMSPYPVALAERGLGGSAVSMSPLPGRHIGETAKIQKTSSGREALFSRGSSPSSVGAGSILGGGFMDSGTATVVAQQEQLLTKSAARQQMLHKDPCMHGGPVGNTVDSVGGVPGELGESSNVRQPGDESVGQSASSPGQLEVFYGGAESRGQRDYQQDRHTIIRHFEPHCDTAAAGPPHKLGLAAVFDGHKRCQAAELAHKRLPELLSRDPKLFSANKGSGRDEVCSAIVKSFKTLDKEILEDARKSDIKDCQYGGTTALLALRFDKVLYVAHTGDSGAVMACAAYNLQFPVRLTADHKPNRPDEHARIQDAGGNIDEARDRVVSDPKPHNHRVTLLNMSRSLGDPQFKKGKGDNTVECMPDMRRIELQPGDTALVLASDGLWDKVSDTTVVAILDKVRAKKKALDDSTAKAAAQALVNEALREGTHDNVTAVVMLFKWA